MNLHTTKYQKQDATFVLLKRSLPTLTPQFEVRN